MISAIRREFPELEHFLAPMLLAFCVAAQGIDLASTAWSVSHGGVEAGAAGLALQTGNRALAALLWPTSMLAHLPPVTWPFAKGLVIGVMLLCYGALPRWRWWLLAGLVPASWLVLAVAAHNL